jgi:hypothetical protein
MSGVRVAGLVLVAAALALLVGDVARVVARLSFDYDLLLWGDDYFMTSMLKLAHGLPVYTSVADANSTVYSPGGPWLHHALLSPLGLGTSLLANRLLSQLWLWVAVGLAVVAVVALARRSDSWPEERGARAVVVALAVATLGLAAYANPVTDSLHPTNLELVTLAATLLVLVRFPSLSARARFALLVVLPVVALLAKQTAGAAVTLALCAAAFRDAKGARLRRALAALVPLASLAGALVALTVGTHGLFETWAFDILARHPFDWWKVKDLYAGYFLLFAPALATVGFQAWRVLGGQDAGARGAAWLRAATLPLAYAPFALAALFKTMGGPNNLAVVGFLLVVLALPVWATELAGASRAASGRSLPRAAALGVLAAAQIGVLYPRRRVPDRHDRDNARLICDYAAERMAAGERVHLGRGSVCYLRGGVPVPLDRLSSIVEVTVAGRGAELGFHGRIARSEYDVLIVPLNDLLWFGKDFWSVFSERYRPFFATRGELDNDFWFDGWQGFVSWPMVFFERVSDRGRHHVRAEGGAAAEAPGGARSSSDVPGALPQSPRADAAPPR